MIIKPYNIIIKPWRMELQVELQHLPWPFQSPDLILPNHCGEMSAFLKQLADVILDNIQLETIQKLYESIQRIDGGNTP